MARTCQVCSGTEFNFEDGYYYCNECQTQTQEQEYAHDIEDTVKVKDMKRMNKQQDKRKEVNTDRITSWECYNYILLGLVNELIELGADKDLKEIVKVLWFKYLRRIQVIRKADRPPKLQAYNCLKDAEIIYGRYQKKKPKSRKKKKTEKQTVDITTLDEKELLRERSKGKSALAKRAYLSATQQTETSTLNFESLTNLKSQEPVDPSQNLQFERHAVKALKKSMTKGHYKRHCRDVNSSLVCHKLSYRLTGRKYADGPYVVSRNRIYSIIYIGLLINKDDIQLGDMMRYIREGHLSYQKCDHFFPEDIIEKKLNICTFNQGKKPLTSAGVRSCAAQLVSFIKVVDCMPLQNLYELCRRYCEELNLPDQIFQYTFNLITRTIPKLPITKETNSIPNYEGRSMCFIIFTLKLYFSLDDETEYEFSHFADAVNKNFNDEISSNTFNFISWLKYIEYRKLVMHSEHFPTQYLNDNFSQPDNFISFMSTLNERNKTKDYELPLEMQYLKTLIDEIKDHYDYSPPKYEFKPTLTPFRDHVNVLLSSPRFYEKNYLLNLLNIEFKTTTLDYLGYMRSYKELLLDTSNITYKHGGKNEIQMTNPYYPKYEKKRERLENRKVVNVTIDRKRSIRNRPILGKETSVKRIREDSDDIIYEFNTENQSIFEKNERENAALQKTKKFKKISVNVEDDSTNLKIDDKVYDSSECFWLNSQDVSSFTNQEFDDYFKLLPYNFRLVIKECARVIEQTERDLYMEYFVFETCLSNFKFETQEIANCSKTKDMKRWIEKAKKLW